MSQQPVIIVKRARHQGHGHHGGAWKVAYADFVTAMMAFFLVMWLLAQNASVRHAVAAYFRDPEGVTSGKVSVAIGPGKDPGAAVKEAAAAAATNDAKALEQSAERIREVLDAMPDLKKLQDQIQIQPMPGGGLRIEMQESATSWFFDTGSARMKERAVQVFDTVGRELAKLPNDVHIEGHTDSRKYSGADGYTNWELSADRANSARRVLEHAGVRPGQVTGVHGYADTQLANPKDPLEARNRRVAIIVQPRGEK